MGNEVAVLNATLVCRYRCLCCCCYYFSCVYLCVCVLCAASFHLHLMLLLSLSFFICSAIGYSVQTSESETFCSVCNLPNHIDIFFKIGVPVFNFKSISAHTTFSSFPISPHSHIHHTDSEHN